MQRIIQANIDRFKLLLDTERDPTKRVVLLRLLNEQAAQLELGKDGAADAKKAF